MNTIRILESALMLIPILVATSYCFTSDVSADDGLLWYADHETGDLSQYTANWGGGSYDNYNCCIRPPGGVVAAPEPVFNGNYAMKMTAPIHASRPACRQFRWGESSGLSEGPLDDNPLYYSVWLYFPKHYEVVDWTNIVQFKSRVTDDHGIQVKNDPFWCLCLRNRPDGAGSMYFRLFYFGKYCPGPYQGGGTNIQSFDHDLLDVTVAEKEWVNIQIYLRQSTHNPGEESNYDGQIVVWQDGVEIYNMDNVVTRHPAPNSSQHWSVNVYTMTEGIKVDGELSDLVMYVDDAKIGENYICIERPEIAAIVNLNNEPAGQTLIALVGSNFGECSADLNYNPYADIDCNGKVQFRDYQRLANAYTGADGVTTDPACDLEGNDGDVDFADFNRLINAYGTSCGTSYVEFPGGFKGKVEKNWWTNTHILCTVPYDAVSGEVYVVTSKGRSKGFNFAVIDN